jgi:hypothetical protein
LIPLILPVNGTVDVVEGSNLTLNCDNPGNTGSTSYQWFNVTGSERSNRETTPPALLTFNNIQRTSSGVYICRSSKTNIDMIRESTVTINVQYPPNVSIISSFNGSTLIITCTTDGNPSSPDVVWLHNGAPLNINQLTINTQSTYSELIINTNYSGTYICTVNNTIGHDTSNPITISGISPESITTISTTRTQLVTITHLITTTISCNPIGGTDDSISCPVSVTISVIMAIIVSSITTLIISLGIFCLYHKATNRNKDNKEQPLSVDPNPAYSMVKLSTNTAERMYEQLDN